MLSTTKLKAQFIAEMAVANVKMPVVCFVKRPMPIKKDAPPLMPNSMNIALSINKMIMIARKPVFSPDKSGKLNSICDDTQIQI